MKNVFYFLITISLIINIKTTSLNDNKTSCYKLQGEEASKENCNGIYVGYNEQYDSCCFITYRNKTTKEDFQRCAVVENTEYGLKRYKNELKVFSKIKIICACYFHKINLMFIFILSTLLF